MLYNSTGWASRSLLTKPKVKVVLVVTVWLVYVSYMSESMHYLRAVIVLTEIMSTVELCRLN